MLDYKPNIVLSNDEQEYKVIGTRPVRPDGADKVTGKANYSADINLPGMLYGKVLRSPHAHAVIRSIDTSKAEALPGVRAVVTSADIEKPSGRASELAEGAMVNYKFLSNNVIADGKALYKGHAIAAVAAANPHLAEQALSLIDVDFEVLTPVMDAKEAMKEDAPLVHERLAGLTTSSIRAGGVLDDDDATKGTNIANHFEFKLGDPEEGFNQADFVVEKEVSTVAVHQGYIEPHQRHGPVARGREPDRLVQQPGPVHGAGVHRPAVRRPSFQGKGHPHGNWRRIWRQADHVHGTPGGASGPQGRRAGQDVHEPYRGL